MTATGRNRNSQSKIVHKDQHYPGEHEPIIDEPLWEQVQRKLAANGVERATGERMLSPSLLAGLLYDGEGHRMTPSHAVKNGMRYRYCASQPLIGKTREAAPEGLRIAAAEIERNVRRSASSDLTAKNDTVLSREDRIILVLHYIIGQERQGAALARRGYPKAVSVEGVPDRIAAKPRKSRGISTPSAEIGNHGKSDT